MNVINVERPSLELHHSLYTWESTQVINLMNVKYVGKPSVKAHLLLCIWEAIQVRSPMVVMNVEKPSLSSQLLLYIWESTLEKSLISVVSVGKLLARSHTILDTREFILIKILLNALNLKNLQQNSYQKIHLTIKWHEHGKSFNIQNTEILSKRYNVMKTYTSRANTINIVNAVLLRSSPIEVKIQSWTPVSMVLEGPTWCIKRKNCHVICLLLWVVINYLLLSRY